MEKYGFIYIWFDRKRKMFYVGSHWGTEDDGYICSSNRMRDAYRRRPEDFGKKRILSKIYTNRLDLFNEEFKWLSLIKDEELGKKYYNLRKWHAGHWTTDENKRLSMGEKISIKVKENFQDPEFRKKYEEGLKTRDYSYIKTSEKYIESRSILGKANKGRKHTGEALKNIQEAAKKRIPNIEGCKKVGSKSVKIINAMKVKCSKCGFESNPGLIARHHNENCKEPNWTEVKEDFNTGMSFRKLQIKYNIDRKVIKKRIT